MNDFTKEELEIIDDSLYGGMHDDYPVPEENLILQRKIQKMIENYCDHLPELKSTDDSPLFVGCKFCDKVFYDE